MSTRDEWKAVIRENIAVPPHIQACANACLYDLLHGPSWCRIPWGNVENFTDDDYATYRGDLDDECNPDLGDRLEETYVGTVGNTLRDWIADLPSEVWVDTDCGAFMEREPEQYEEVETGEVDDDGSPVMEMVECYMEATYHLDQQDIVEALFGKTFRREFS